MRRCELRMAERAYRQERRGRPASCGRPYTQSRRRTRTCGATPLRAPMRRWRARRGVPAARVRPCGQPVPPPDRRRGRCAGRLCGPASRAAAPGCRRHGEASLWTADFRCETRPQSAYARRSGRGRLSRPGHVEAQFLRWHHWSNERPADHGLAVPSARCVSLRKKIDTDARCRSGGKLFSVH